MLKLSVIFPNNCSKDYLNKEYDQLYIEINRNLISGTVEYMQDERIVENRSVLDIIQGLILQGINIGAFTALYAVLKTWLDNRPRCEVTLTYPGGSTIKVTRVSPEDAIKIHEQYMIKIKETNTNQNRIE
jgi:hypothetical protein